MANNAALEDSKGTLSDPVLGPSLLDSVSSSSLLVVGAGGIGCELLKNLVLTGFSNIHVIDLDTIDVSNLNRQFLFQKKHVSKPKAVVARESVLRFKPDANITAFHDTVMNPDYNRDFFAQFNLVMNALDNKAARNHVNRMCLAANVPLVESGTAGYLGQVTVIKKGETECYECQPKPAQKSFPGCTIRNTPSEPVHCIVWAKHLFNQLFGEFDADNEVSPDTADPELGGEAGKQAAENENGEIQRKSTREWAQEIDYDGQKLFNKFFHSDIEYLLSMEKLWQKRRPPEPLSWENMLQRDQSVAFQNDGGLPDKRIWTIHECGLMFQKCVMELKERFLQSGEPLVWDKDDDTAMDFVAATANIRSKIFHIAVQSRFDVKSMAGNIIPAIATTNAIIAGLMVMEALKILNQKFSTCRTVYLNRQVKTKNRLLMPCMLDKPNPKCYVCASKPEVTVHLDVDTVTCKQLEERLFKERFGMVAPDVEVDDGRGSIIISSEEGETEQNWDKPLSYFKITSGTLLKGDDFLQDYQLNVLIRHKVGIDPPDIFQLEGEVPEVPQEEKPGSQSSAAITLTESEPSEKVSVTSPSPTRKRKISESYEEVLAIKKRKSSESKNTSNGNTDDDDIVIL